MPVKTTSAKPRKPAPKPAKEEPSDLQPGLMGDDDASKSRKPATEAARKVAPTPFDAGGESLESTAEAIAALKVRVARQFGEIEQGLMGEFARLEAVRGAIAAAARVRTGEG